MRRVYANNMAGKLNLKRRGRDLVTAASLLALMGFGGARASAATLVVSPGNLQGWQLVTTDDAGVPPGHGSVGFVLGPQTPPLGTGSATLTTSTFAPPVPGNGGAESAQIRTPNFKGTNLSDITALKYCSFADSWNGQQLPYLTLFLNLEGNPNGPVDDEIFFEPAYQSPTSGNPLLPNQWATQGMPQLGKWQCWDARNGGWWSNSGVANPGNGVQSLSYYSSHVTHTGNIVIVNSSTGLGGVRLTVGFASPGDQFNGFVDNFMIQVKTAATTYDFELNGPNSTGSCKDKDDGDEGDHGEGQSDSGHGDSGHGH